MCTHPYTPICDSLLHPPPTHTHTHTHTQTLSRIQTLIQSKLDVSTLHYLQQAEKHVDSETYNMRVEVTSPHLTYCLWGNVVKNPRYI